MAQNTLALFVKGSLTSFTTPILFTPIFVGGVVPVLVLVIIEFNTSEHVEGTRGGSVRV